VRRTRVHVALELATGGDLLLPLAPSMHLLRVLRLRPGAALTLFNGQGGEFTAELLASERGSARVRLLDFDAIERESALRITLLQGLARGERMDLIIQKATELGVTEIVPLACEFSVVRLAAHAMARRRERWQAVAISACEQCGRNRPPIVQEIATLENACAATRTVAGTGTGTGTVSTTATAPEPAPGPPDGQPLLLMLVPEATESLGGLTRSGAHPAAGNGAPLRTVTLLVGPEGGLSGREQLLAQRAGFHACRLGPRVLRTETAPLAALAALQALAGDLAT